MHEAAREGTMPVQMTALLYGVQHESAPRRDVQPAARAQRGAPGPRAHELGHDVAERAPVLGQPIEIDMVVRPAAAQRGQEERAVGLVDQRQVFHAVHPPLRKAGAPRQLVQAVPARGRAQARRRRPEQQAAQVLRKKP
jgi:hypothetical protein